LVKLGQTCEPKDNNKTKELAMNGEYTVIIQKKKKQKFNASNY
jgi:hypothetical protein